MRVRIENYQIIEKADLEFDRGLNIIVGDTNNGKSSIFRAIKSAVFNKLGDSFIQDGKKKSRVDIESDGDSVIWEKYRDRSPATKYIINGEDFEKVGRTQFEKVADTLNMKEIELTSSDKEKLNFWKQMEYPFLLDKTSSQLFEFLSLSSEDDNLTEIIKEMNSDLKDIESKKDKLEGGIDTLQEIVRDEKEYLKSKEGFKQVYEEILNLESDVHLVEDVDGIIGELNKLERKYNRVVEVQSKVKDLIDTINFDYIEIEDLLDDFEELKPIINELNKLYQKLNKVKGRKRKLRDIINKVDLDSLEIEINNYKSKEKEVIELESKIKSLNDLYKRLSDIRDKKENLKKLIERVDLDSLEKEINEYKDKEKVVIELRSDIKELNKLQREWQKWKDKKKKAKNKIDLIEEELDSFDICPLCGSEV